MPSEASLSLQLIRWIIRIYGNKFTQETFPKLKAMIERRTYPQPAPIPGRFRRFAGIQVGEVNHQQVFTLSSLKNRQLIHIIYTHGGAYFQGLHFIHWLIIHQLIQYLGATVTVPIYPLTPEHSYRDAFPMLKAIYQEVLEKSPGQAIILCGDSAGGGLALAQAIHYRNLGLPLPQRVVLFSPWLDITLSNPDAARMASQDIILGIPGLVQCGKWWAGGDNPHSPLLSPIFGDLSGLPPIDVFIGTKELLLPDARKLAQVVPGAGGIVNLHETPGAFHDFVAATITPESKKVFDILQREMMITP